TDDHYARASMYHNIATVIAHSDIDKAETLWKKSLEIKENINDSYGKASTLANLAWIAHSKANTEEETAMYKESAKILGITHAWNDLLTVLLNLSRADKQRSVIYQAQALYLITFIDIDADTI